MHLLDGTDFFLLCQNGGKRSGGSAEGGNWTGKD